MKVVSKNINKTKIKKTAYGLLLFKSNSITKTFSLLILITLMIFITLTEPSIQINHILTKQESEEKYNTIYNSKYQTSFTSENKYKRDLILVIDFGEKHSSISVLINNNRIERVKDEYNNYLIPTIVSFLSNKTILTGYNAWIIQNKNQNLSNTIYKFKHLLGKNINDPSVIRIKNNVLFDIKEHDNDVLLNFYSTNNSSNEDYSSKGKILKTKITYLNYNNADSTSTEEIVYYSFEEVLSIFLIQLKKYAENYFINTQINKVIITIPNYFNQKQRSSMKLAANLAGLELVKLIPDNSGLAVYYYNKHLKYNINDNTGDSSGKSYSKYISFLSLSTSSLQFDLFNYRNNLTTEFSFGNGTDFNSNELIANASYYIGKQITQKRNFTFNNSLYFKHNLNKSTSLCLDDLINQESCDYSVILHLENPYIQQLTPNSTTLNSLKGFRYYFDVSLLSNIEKISNENNLLTYSNSLSRIQLYYLNNKLFSNLKNNLKMITETIKKRVLGYAIEKKIKIVCYGYLTKMIQVRSILEEINNENNNNFFELVYEDLNIPNSSVSYDFNNKNNYSNYILDGSTLVSGVFNSCIEEYTNFNYNKFYYLDKSFYNVYLILHDVVDNRGSDSISKKFDEYLYNEVTGAFDYKILVLNDKDVYPSSINIVITDVISISGTLVISINEELSENSSEYYYSSNDALLDYSALLSISNFPVNSAMSIELTISYEEVGIIKTSDIIISNCSTCVITCKEGFCLYNKINNEEVKAQLRKSKLYELYTKQLRSGYNYNKKIDNVFKKPFVSKIDNYGYSDEELLSKIDMIYNSKLDF